MSFQIQVAISLTFISDKVRPEQETFDLKCKCCKFKIQNVCQRLICVQINAMLGHLDFVSRMFQQSNLIVSLFFA